VTTLPRILEAVNIGQTVLVRRQRGGPPSRRFEPATVLAVGYGAQRELDLDGVPLVGGIISVRWEFDGVDETVDWHFGSVRELPVSWVREVYLLNEAELEANKTRLGALAKLLLKLHAP
jgi:hypothetical protein